MVETVIRALIGLVLIVLCVFLIVWVLGEIGLAIPGFVVKLLYVIAILVAILWLVRILRPHWPGWFP